MIEPRSEKFQWGQRVIAGIDLLNDGSHPECGEDELIVAQGTSGEIVQIGRHEESGTPVYIVEFSIGSEASRVVGCFEEELSLV